MHLAIFVLYISILPPIQKKMMISTILMDY